MRRDLRQRRRKLDGNQVPGYSWTILPERINMPYTRFICPDGGEIPIEECLQACRLNGVVNPDTEDYYVPCGRCLSVPTLKAVARQREWDGKPSTTQLLRGTREAYLMLTKEYAIDPKSMMFALHGTNTHSVLEENSDGLLAEQRLDDGVSTGAFDLWTPENGGTLVDYKTYGSYVAASVMGMGTKKVHIGSYKNGKPKYKTVITYGNAKHMFDLAVQMNDYRMKLKKCLGKDTKQLVCEIIVRDGNTYMATNRGITENAYLVPVGMISDIWVSRYMNKKADDLHKALETDIIPAPCKPRECWGGNKCQKYCAVNKFCDCYTEEVNGNY